jgi:hypothetical protein
VKKNPTATRLTKMIGKNRKLRALAVKVIAIAGRSRFASRIRSKRLARTFYQKLVDKD